MEQYLSSMILISKLTFCRCPLHGLCRVYALAAGPNIYSTFVPQFLLIMMMLDPLLLIPCLEIRRFLGAIERRLRSVCAIPHPNGHCSVIWKLITNKTILIANYEVSRQISSEIKQLSLNLLSHFHGENVKVITTNNKINILCVSTLVRLN